MSVRVLKWPVPVDGQAHPIGTGPVALIDHQGDPGVVFVWTIELGDPDPIRQAVVVGTGHVVPENAVRDHLGSVQIAGFGLVWHVFAEAYQ